MIGYVTIGSNDLSKSRLFYDAILAPLGGRVLLETPKMAFYATPGGASMLAITTPYDQGVATFGNGSMFGLPAHSNLVVDEVYAIARENGAASEGEPGYRSPNMYIGYFRDPYGNKLAVYHMPSVEDFALVARQMLDSQPSD